MWSSLTTAVNAVSLNRLYMQGVGQDFMTGLMFSSAEFREIDGLLNCFTGHLAASSLLITTIPEKSQCRLYLFIY